MLDNNAVSAAPSVVHSVKKLPATVTPQPRNLRVPDVDSKRPAQDDAADDSGNSTASASPSTSPTNPTASPRRAAKRLRSSSNANNANAAVVPSSSLFSNVPEIPMDPIFALAGECIADPDPLKINLSIGAYRGEDGKPWVLPVVRKAEEIILKGQMDHEYLPIDGLRSFTDLSAKLILGAESKAIKEGRFVAVQTISGTGAVRLGADFLARFRKSPVYISDPTWGNHFAIFEDAGFDVRTYKYWDAEKRGMNYEGVMETFRNAPDGSILLLHACAHNPTGIDPTESQWREIAAVCRQKNHFPFFDCAYQGFASGDLDRDALAIRMFVDMGFELFVAQSYSKNFGLYGERTGCLTMVSNTPGIDGRARSQLCRLNRACISNPPSFGARVVDIVLKDPKLYEEWKESLATMARRIDVMRKAAYARLVELKTPGDWSHITSQIGMFTYTGLSRAQCLAIKKKFHVYMAENGRVSMAGLNTTNVVRFADALDWVVRNVV
ncbi:Aspartate aminotransferase, cytoplasmic [Irineochytrium annulatum]|nr:Aspartate aminotransferase, cytoplasmic [Irineochytrium annulatum]